MLQGVTGLLAAVVSDWSEADDVERNRFQKQRYFWDSSSVKVGRVKSSRTAPACCVS